MNPRKRLWLRQKQGAGNSLGRIKFIFHNAFGVYLHDTPEKQYFKRTRRNFSHGCVRLENPAALAESLMTMTMSKRPKKPVAELMKGSAHEVYYMTPHMPIHLLYRTAWMEADGSVDFLPDIYGWDDELAGLPADVTLRAEHRLRVPWVTGERHLLILTGEAHRGEGLG